MQKICSNVVFISIIMIFISIFIFARAFISIGFIAIILVCFLDKRVFLQLKHNLALQSLLISAILINIGMLYILIKNNSLPLKTFFGFANPLLMILYICSASYLLSKQRKYINYLIYTFISIVSIFSLIALIIFFINQINGKEFIVSDIYMSFNGGATIQSIVALTFPLSAVIIVSNALKLNKLFYKIVLLISALCIVFVDLFINRSKVGYITEFTVFIYYAYTLIKNYSLKKDFSLKKKLTICTVVLIALLGSVTVSYKFSNIFHQRVSQATHEFNEFFSKNYSKKMNNKLSTSGSVGPRLLYYTSSIKVFKNYPSVLLYGCPISKDILNIKECTKELIDNSKLNTEVKIVHDGIMPHNEFISYTFQGGILAGICLLGFFILLYFRESEQLSNSSNRLYLKVLVIAMFIGCCFDYFITTQIMVILFCSLLAIFLADKKVST